MTDSRINTRTVNVTRNIGYGIMQAVVSLVLPFIVRTILIYRFGADYLGLNSLFTSILSVLSIAELGFSTAVVYSMYRPAAYDDEEGLCAYLAYYRKIYRVIGLVILTIGLILLPLLPHLVHDKTLPGGLNLYLCYMIFLGDSVISYLLYGYMTAIPTAFQRRDILSRITMVAALLRCVVQSLLLLGSENFYFYLLSIPAVTVCRNILTAVIVRRDYPNIVCRGELSISERHELYKKVYGLFVNKLFAVSRNGIDSICISAFIGLAMTGIYNNYLLILMGINTICGVITSSMMPSAGNSIIKKSREENYLDMRRFDFMYLAVFGWTTICLLCVFQPFMKLWVGETMMLGITEVLGLCAYFYIMRMGDMRWVYHEGAGLWWECRHLSIIEAIVNITLNILLCRFLGVFGIILATDLTIFFINFMCFPVVLFRVYFKNGKLAEFFFDHLQYALTMMIAAVSAWYLCKTILIITRVSNASLIGVLMDIVLRILICTVVYISVFLLMWGRSRRYKDAKKWVGAALSVMSGRQNNIKKAKES